MMPEKKVLEDARKEGLALTFNDVRLKTRHTEIMPDEADTRSNFSRNVECKIPIVSAAMDTVTESGMAISLAREGGIGVIHRNMSASDQAREVDRVKHDLLGWKKKPICVSDYQTVYSVLKRAGKKGYHFRSFPVLDGNEQLTGIVTSHDFDFCDDEKVLIRDIMSKGPLTVSEETDIEEAYKIMKREKKKILPMVGDGGSITGMYVLKDVKGILTGGAEKYNIDGNGQLRVAAAIGTGRKAIKRAEKLYEKNVDAIVIDTAHADTKPMFETMRSIKNEFRDIDVVAGNVSTGDSAKRLADAGADGIKVGQGPGAICTTRVIAGIGRPQVSAVYDCVRTIEENGYDIPVCADGGLRFSGDIAIAIASGAKTVMLGSMLAGTDESPGEIVYAEGRQWKDFRGMGSLGAMEESRGSRERYFQKGKKDIIPEGVEGMVPYKGKLNDLVVQYIGGLKRSMGYLGAGTIEELRERGEFDRITSAGYTESRPHDVKIVKQSPNYKE